MSKSGHCPKSIDITSRWDQNRLSQLTDPTQHQLNRSIYLYTEHCTALRETEKGKRLLTPNWGPIILMRIDNICWWVVWGKLGLGLFSTALYFLRQSCIKLAKQAFILILCLVQSEKGGHARLEAETRKRPFLSSRKKMQFCIIKPLWKFCSLK